MIDRSDRYSTLILKVSILYLSVSLVPGTVPINLDSNHLGIALRVFE